MDRAPKLCFFKFLASNENELWSSIVCHSMCCSAQLHQISYSMLHAQTQSAGNNQYNMVSTTKNKDFGKFSGPGGVLLCSACSNLLLFFMLFTTTIFSSWRKSFSVKKFKVEFLRCAKLSAC